MRPARDRTRPARLRDAGHYQYERHDGRSPAFGRYAEMIPRPAKILHLALAADLVRGLSGADAAAAMVSQRTGTYFDPHVAEAYLDLAGGTTCINAEVEDQGSTWDGNLPSGRSLGERAREGRGREGRGREGRGREGEGARGEGARGEGARAGEVAGPQRA